jgi:2-polyprenyl-3-methyl-5-hydroxy-6-metoxy-1,4-benzoquinol methylase
MPVEVFLLDGSERMVAAAARKIGQARPEAVAGWRVADLSREGWDGGLERGAYDAVISTLVLEHLPIDCYSAVIEKCFYLLRPGGWLMAAEGYREADSDMLEWFSEEMEERRRALDPEISDRVARLREDGEVHYYCSKAEKAEILRKAGFQQVNTLWQYLCIALMVGRKPIPLSSYS